MNRRIQSIDEYQNSFNQEQPLNEAYKSTDVSASDPNITSQKDLETYILNNMGKAFTELLKNKINLKYNVNIKINRGYFDIDGDAISGANLGILQYGIKELFIGTFSGNKLPIFKDGEFPRYIWSTIHYSYSHGAAHTSSRGSNGCSLYFPNEDSDNIYYDIIDKKFYTVSDLKI